jgi:hypothetical protein
MANRKSISKKVRFEVFKRDNFTCQYCGRMAPDVVLEVDHINAVANGGTNDIMNLVTSCFDCNRGKGKRKLSEKSELKKQQEQLKQLSEKREQLKMMLDWKNELLKFTDEQAKEFKDHYSLLTDTQVTEYGMEKVKKWIKQFGLVEIIECAEISVSQYFEKENKASWEKTFSYIPRIAMVRKRQKDNPVVGKQNYIKGILRNRISYVNENTLREMLRKIQTEEEAEDVIDMALSCRNWTDFREQFEDMYGGAD